MRVNTESDYLRFFKKFSSPFYMEFLHHKRIQWICKTKTNLKLLLWIFNGDLIYIKQRKKDWSKKL